MATKIVVPELGESVVEATVGAWRKQVGDVVAAGDVLVELQTDKVDLEVTADVAGVLTKIERAQDADVEIGDVLGYIAGADGSADGGDNIDSGRGADATPAVKPAAPAATPAAGAANGDGTATPVARRMAAAEGVDLEQLSGSGRGGKVTKADVAAAARPTAVVQPTAPAAPVPPASAPPTATEAPPALAALFGSAPREQRVKLSRRRRTIARNLVQAQQTAAMLTTFNEVDMQAVIDLRNRRKAWFEEKYGVRLGFMSFFTKASVAALKQFPRLNAEIDGDEMVLKQHYDIGIAVGSEEGLVVPVVRDADRLSFAAIEHKIRAFGKAAQDGALKLEDLLGGTFTITNGGIFGSMLSTPILNTPQVGILGLHNIVERPVAINGEVVIRPIMYVALTYDHRIVDGREAVQFLYRIKELIEDPEQLLLAG